MADDFKVTVDPPFAEFRAQLRRVAAELPKELQKANKEIATDVANRAGEKYSAAHPSRSGRGRKSIRGLATQTRAQVAIGSKRTPYIVGQNFGAANRRRFPQFPVRRKPDYFLYDTIGELNDEIEDLYKDAVDDLMRVAFPNGTPSGGLI